MARQRRRRRKGPAEYPGPRKTKLPFPINLIFNIKAFYVFFIVVMIASMAAVGLGVGQAPNPEPPPIIDLTPAPSVTPNVQSFDSPGRVLDGTERYKAILKTSEGDIVIEFETDTPEAVNSFAFLAAKGYFDDTAFFYVDKTYVAQAGDPNCSLGSEQTCTGYGNPGYSLPLETGAATHAEWAVAMPAIDGEESRVAGSQFRIFFVEDSRLDGKETVFGHVVQGQDILEGTPDLKICSALTQQTAECTDDLAQALIIEDVVVEPA